MIRPIKALLSNRNIYHIPNCNSINRKYNNAVEGTVPAILWVKPMEERPTDYTDYERPIFFGNPPFMVCRTCKSQITKKRYFLLTNQEVYREFGSMGALNEAEAKVSEL